MSGVPQERLTKDGPSSKDGQRLELEKQSPKAALAMKLFRDGFNCSQSVLGAFCADFGLEREPAMRLASSFGGGIGRMREVCGAVSGMCMAAGLAEGYADPHAQTEKAEHYARIQKLAAAFRELNGSIVCRELLGLGEGGSDPVPAARTDAYYRKRPCEILVGQAALILESHLAGTR
ncbi:C-GCAxxG-C-C family protein [Treponema brennaborense]|uniref:C_GCAxxG_C_C family protein n=1 Tax=Treponema brennaborense (strain DSM 12168 / CIP 105900 / DD5/3) TaxID=906968 RepID=F4LKB0_TREBD|nr:C-GCAxxG-C-C family protein [Treponema brennaborense]AEE16484.1 C_GCAxxG_C_C family protein [Treponema brennaborense DSM 12168]